MVVICCNLIKTPKTKSLSPYVDVYLYSCNLYGIILPIEPISCFSFYRFSPDLLNSSVFPSLKARLDLSAEYLILTDVQRKVRAVDMNHF